MKAASSEWYSTKTRHVLPAPTASLPSSLPSYRNSQRFINGSTSPSSSSRYHTSSLSNSITNDPSASTASSSTKQRSLPTLSTTSSNNTSSTKRKPYSFSKSRSRQSNSTRTAATSSTTDPSTSTSFHRTLPSTSSRSGEASTSSYQYKLSRPLYPLGISSSYHTSSFPRISETDGAFTEEENFIASQPIDEASTEDDEDDEQVYAAFTNSLRMLRVHHRDPRSISPAISLRSVLTELEEDEEDLPPDQVDDAVTTEEEEDDEEPFITAGSTSSYPAKSVPKSPVKVRVKVEKASSSDHDSDRVKVTLQLEPETELSEEENSDTSNTLETVRYNAKMRELSYRTDDDESDDYGDYETERSGQSDSEILSEVPDEFGRTFDKTDSMILTPPPYLGNPYRHVSSLGDLPSRIFGSTRSPTGRSHTIHEIQNKRYSESNKKSDFSSIHKPSHTGGTPPPNPSSQSETSSRSQSARVSATRRSSHHKMYGVGGKLRSLSARRSILPPSAHSFISKYHSQHPHLAPIDQSQYSTESSSLKKSTSSSSSNDTLKNPSSTHYMLTKFASLAPPPRSPLPMLPQARSLSATRISNRQLQQQLRQLSLENITSLPPITPTSPSQSLSRPRPLLRNDTYTVLNYNGHGHPCHDEHDLPSPFSPPGYVNPCVGEHLAMHQIVNDMSTSFNKKSVPVPLPYDTFMTAALSFRRDPSSHVSFSNYVREQSLSKFQAQSSSRSASGSQDGEEEDEEQAEMDKEMREEALINKNVITLGELEQESGDEDEPKQKKDKLKKFALATIRKQMQMERKRLATIELNSDGESEEDNEEDDDESSSDEETVSTKKKSDGTHIPVPTSDQHLPDGEGGEKGPAKPVPEKKESGDQSLGKISEEQEEWSWKNDLGRTIDREMSPLRTRPNTAESGYRAVPPSRASSGRRTPDETEEDAELKKEKDALLEEWKKSGRVGSPPASSAPKSVSGTGTAAAGTRAATESLLSGGGGNDGSESFSLPNLVQGNINLNLEYPDDEEKLARVWEEFNKDEQIGAAQADYEFSTLLDEMIQDVNNYKPRLSTSGVNSNSLPSNSLQVGTKASRTPYDTPKFDPSRKYQSLSEMVSLLSHNLRLVSAETLEDHMASLISLVASILKKVRKNKTDDDYVSQIACLSTIRVLCDRLQEMHNSQNLKYADLSWLFRILCKYSSDSNSTIRPEASFCLARLVKVAGPTLVVRPIYFILVMESEGGGNKTAATGSKTKAAAIDTLTYALLTFPKEDFHNLEEIAGWVCIAMLSEERRIRQSCLECLSIISQHMGGREKSLPLFHTLFLKEELDHFSRSPSPESMKSSRKTGKSGRSGGKGTDVIPLSVHGTVRLLTGPGFPIAQPIDAITARLDKDILPVPSTKGLIEYAVNVPTGKDLVLLMTHMLDKDDDEWDFSSSSDSMDDSEAASVQSKRSSQESLGFSDIDWTGEGQKSHTMSNPDELISPDVAYILLGKGRVNKQEVVLLDTYKKEIIPEIIQMLKKSQGKRRNRKRYGKRKGRSSRRKGQRKEHDPFAGILDEPDERKRPMIPTISLDGNDTTRSGDEEDEHSGDSFDNDNSPVVVFVDPPDLSEPSQTTESATQGTSQS